MVTGEFADEQTEEIENPEEQEKQTSETAIGVEPKAVSDAVRLGIARKALSILEQRIKESLKFYQDNESNSEITDKQKQGIATDKNKLGKLLSEIAGIKSNVELVDKIRELDTGKTVKEYGMELKIAARIIKLLYQDADHFINSRDEKSLREAQATKQSRINLKSDWMKLIELEETKRSYYVYSIVGTLRKGTIALLLVGSCAIL